MGIGEWVAASDPGALGFLAGFILGCFLCTLIGAIGSRT